MTNVDTKEYFDWWADFLLVNYGEVASLVTCDELLSIAPTSVERDRVINIRDAIVKKVQKRLN